MELKAPAESADRAFAATERQLRLLEELGEIGMGLARGLGRYAAQAGSAEVPFGAGGTMDRVPASGPFAGVDVALAFSRIARAVRQIVALEQQTLGLRETRAQVLRRERRQSVRRAVRAAVEADHPEIERHELDGLLSDLFLDYDDYDDGADGTEAETIARLRQALEAELYAPEAGDEEEDETDDPFDADGFDEAPEQDAIGEDKPDKDGLRDNRPGETRSAGAAPCGNGRDPPPWRWPGSPHLHANGHDPP